MNYTTSSHRSAGIDRRVTLRRNRLLAMGWTRIAPDSYCTGMVSQNGRELLYTTLAYSDAQTFWEIVASKLR